MATYPRTPRTTPHRSRDRVGYDRAAVHAALDEAWHCHLAFTIAGRPAVLPTLHVRIGEAVYVHGSTGSGPMLAARTAAGLPVCLTVTLLDGLVYARSLFHHSVNYRAVVAHGDAHLVSDPAERRRVFRALVDRFGAGRSDDARAVSDREDAQTAVLRLDLREVSYKERRGGPVDDPGDHALPHWAGVVALRVVPGAPVTDTGVTAAPPPYLPTA
ncbi:MAG TPA: pyridoxamine 5'-phosphate oxidase family protein [Pilimelia sp.]|nr:pyridoxamine 5'-phosphate oxidase family protein [Pilimelia sp.]